MAILEQDQVEFFKKFGVQDKVVASAIIRVKVDFTTNELFDVLSSELLKEYHRVVPKIAQIEFPMAKYLKTILYLHVKHVNMETLDGYNNLRRVITIPLAFAQILIHIGVVYDEIYGLKFVPELNVDADDLLSPSEMLTLSEHLRHDVGKFFATVSGLLNSDEAGSLGFMALAKLSAEQQFVGYRVEHPVYAFYRQFFDVNGVEKVLGEAVMRIKYANASQLAELVVPYVYKARSKAD